MAAVKFKTQLEASSYHAPGGGELYRPLREKIVKQAIEQGYDEATMMEHGVVWADGEYMEYTLFPALTGFKSYLPIPLSGGFFGSRPLEAS